MDNRTNVILTCIGGIGLGILGATLFPDDDLVSYLASGLAVLSAVVMAFAIISR